MGAVVESFLDRLFSRFRPKKKVFFMHIPKCGGTSLSKALRKRSFFSFVQLDARAAGIAVRLLNNIDVNQDHDLSAYQPNLSFYDVQEYRAHMLLYFMSRGSVVVTGHIAFSRLAYEKFGDEYAFITVMREPVNSYVSSYFEGGIQVPAEEFLTTPMGRGWGCRYVKYLNGAIKDLDYRSEKAIQQACKNLKKFTVVGCLEHLDVFAARFKSQLGKSLRIPTKNKGRISSRKRNEVITPSIRKAIERTCEPDLRVYRHTIENYVLPHLESRN